MKIGFKVGGTLETSKEYSEQELFDMNKEKVINDEELKKAIVEFLFKRRRNFHLVIKEKGKGERVDWQEKIKSKLTLIGNDLLKKFILGFNRTAKVKYMIMEEIEKLNGTDDQKMRAIETAINRGIYSINYVRTILKSIRDKDEVETQSRDKEQNIAKELLKNMRDY